MNFKKPMLDQESSSFFRKLPAEIRNAIYEKDKAVAAAFEPVCQLSRAEITPDVLINEKNIDTDMSTWSIIRRSHCPASVLLPLKAPQSAKILCREAYMRRGILELENKVRDLVELVTNEPDRDRRQLLTMTLQAAETSLVWQKYLLGKNGFVNMSEFNRSVSSAIKQIDFEIEKFNRTTLCVNEHYIDVLSNLV